MSQWGDTGVTTGKAEQDPPDWTNARCPSGRTALALLGRITTSRDHMGYSIRLFVTLAAWASAVSIR